MASESEEQLFRQRRFEYRAIHPNMYLRNYDCDITIPEFKKQYDHYEKGLTNDKIIHQMTGKVVFSRKSGNKLFFLAIKSNGLGIQVLANKQFYGSLDTFKDDLSQIQRGDVIWVRGHPARSISGELSIVPKEITIIAPCYRTLPKNEVKDINLRLNHRALDFMLDSNNLEILKMRSTVYAYIRDFLNRKNYTEVETPILSHTFGGASATPFVSKCESLDKMMYMRVAPELYLKRLIIGGLDRVYEIGKQFRNEDIDHTHHPEFSSLELYEAYSNYESLMRMCEDMLFGLVQKTHNSNIITFNENKIDFTTPFRRINIMHELERCIEQPIKFDDFGSDECRQFLIEVCNKHGIECSPPKTNTRLFDKLIGHFIEPQCINPTFLIGHPSIMSPLAKKHPDNPQISQRFELFIVGKEYANAYSEQNDPVEQRHAFELQMKDRTEGDKEVPLPDESFVKDLELGMPQTGGFGLGLDRLIMLLTDTHNIREVIAFPIVATGTNN